MAIPEPGRGHRDLSVADFDFDLPEKLIAQTPRARGASRLLVVDRQAGRWHEAGIGELPTLLDSGDLVVANDTRVFPARLLGRRDPSGGHVECLLIERVDDTHWQALVHPGQKLKSGARLVFEDPVRAPGVRVAAEILEQHFFGRRLVSFSVAGAADLDAAVDQLGHVPLPPYIRRADTGDDRERYQTVFARARGSVAAPTAGLHFDEVLIDALGRRGVGWATITLHVGYGTFKPVRAERVEAHEMDAERFVIGLETAGAVDATRRHGGRVVAVGTTTTRALETAATDDGRVAPGTGSTNLFIYPGHAFGAVDALVTNFHLPRSSLLMLVSAFAGRDLVLAAYRDAVDRGFHFYSYGDAMLIL